MAGTGGFEPPSYRLTADSFAFKLHAKTVQLFYAELAHTPSRTKPHFLLATFRLGELSTALFTNTMRESYWLAMQPRVCRTRHAVKIVGIVM